MEIIICGSISAADEIIKVKNILEKKCHQIEIPQGVKNPELRSRIKASSSEKADVKIKYDLIRGYYEKIKQHDAVLIVNPEKHQNGIAHVLGKKLYCLHPIPAMPYTAEILAMQPIVLDGNLENLELVG